MVKVFTHEEWQILRVANLTEIYKELWKEERALEELELRFFNNWRLLFLQTKLEREMEENGKKENKRSN